MPKEVSKRVPLFFGVEGLGGTSRDVDETLLERRFLGVAGVLAAGLFEAADLAAVDLVAFVFDVGILAVAVFAAVVFVVVLLAMGFFVAEAFAVFFGERVGFFPREVAAEEVLERGDLGSACCVLVFVRLGNFVGLELPRSSLRLAVRLTLPSDSDSLSVGGVSRVRLF